MDKAESSDPFLDKRIAKYDKWLNQGQISFSSKVIPVAESFDAKQWVHPTEQAMEILGNANSVAVQNCDCRSNYKRCDSPLEVCFVLNHIGDKFVSKGKARHVTLTEATEILKRANESGLVHLSLYMPDHEIFALCSCCACCCHDLQIIKRFQRKDLLLKSDYFADTDLEACIQCGECVGRCFFDARLLQNDDQMECNPALCVGCGLCVTICPAEAISMLLRNPEE